jgi:dipeptidyl-peptidase-4
MVRCNRSKAFHDVCWQNLIDAGFPDKKLWIRALAEQYVELDLTRGVGIYGGSAGGQNAVAGLLMHGDLYTVGVADCGCHDNRMDKLWWNELYMGVPKNQHPHPNHDGNENETEDAYVRNANVTYAHQLQRHQKLLLTVGLLDSNVDPASTLQLIQAFIDHDKDNVDVVVFPRLGHGAGESAYGQRKRMEYFVRHIHQKTPYHD